ncbi:MAG TPA: helix-turn-helix domain-containing protein, partial [Chloroflexota bacterium]|nr:helix-turn-helix domain-containing protein [Chloroflexota bacterium]
MPKLLRVELAPDQTEELRLSHRGWTVPEIASHLEVHQATVREALARFAAGGLDALPDRHRAGRPPTLTADSVAAVEALLDAAAERGDMWTL